MNLEAWSTVTVTVTVTVHRFVPDWLTQQDQQLKPWFFFFLLRKLKKCSCEVSKRFCLILR